MKDNRHKARMRMWKPRKLTSVTEIEARCEKVSDLVAVRFEEHKTWYQAWQQSTFEAKRLRDSRFDLSLGARLAGLEIQL